MAKSRKALTKKTAKKIVKKAPKKLAKKPAKKPAKKIAKKAVKKSAKTPALKKATKKPAAAKKVTVKKAEVKKTAPQKLTAVKITPLDDRLMVQLLQKEKVTAGGIYIPDTVSDVSGNLEGVVVSVGRGHRNKKGHVRPMDLKVGDRVLFSEYSGSKIKIQDQDLLILRETDVLGVVG